MKVESFRMQSGKIELRIADSNGGNVTMRFDNAGQISVLSEAIAAEAEKQKVNEPRPKGHQLSLF